MNAKNIILTLIVLAIIYWLFVRKSSATGTPVFQYVDGTLNINDLAQYLTNPPTMWVGDYDAIVNLADYDPFGYTKGAYMNQGGGNNTQPYLNPGN